MNDHLQGATVVIADGLVRIRPVVPADLPRLYEMQLDPDSNRMAVTIPRTRDVFDTHWNTALADPNVIARAILAGEELVGCISCFPMEGKNHVGYWIDRAFWNHGIASRALQLLVRGITSRPLFATAATNNAASLRVLQKCGFALESVRRSPACDRYPECDEAILVLRGAVPSL